MLLSDVGHHLPYTRPYCTSASEIGSGQCFISVRELQSCALDVTASTALTLSRTWISDPRWATLDYNWIDATVLSLVPIESNE